MTGVPLRIATDKRLGAYHFGPGHPFGPGRMAAFLEALDELELAYEALPLAEADTATLTRFHAREYVERVQSLAGTGAPLDLGDTPAVPGIDGAAKRVVGTVATAVDDLLAGRVRRAFVPIAGLHHGQRDRASGFCVYNDCGVALETLLSAGVAPVAYVDIDVHHGDGVYDSFETDPRVIFADIHQDGRTLFPGTGAPEAQGKGAAHGTKLNVPLPPGADDDAFAEAWERIEAHLERHQPKAIVMQCGADGLAGDPLASLRYTSKAHASAARRLRVMAERWAEGRLLALGGGGYDLSNIAAAWTAVVRELA